MPFRIVSRVKNFLVKRKEAREKRRQILTQEKAKRQQEKHIREQLRETGEKFE